jgi:hypothetical protein
VRSKSGQGHQGTPRPPSVQRYQPQPSRAGARSQRPETNTGR